jgi:cytochrome c oxidase subunit 2
VDVTHSFWVPEFGQKQDAVPGMETTLVITPDRQGTFPVICTELCGLGHAVMRSTAEVMTPQKFLSWAKGQQKQLGSSSAATSGKAVFANNGCAACHTLAAAGAKGTVGPDLDKLAQEAQRAGQPLQQFIRESIVNPNKYVAPGFPKGIMPTSFSSLPKAQLDALVSFLAGGKQ